ncbi:MAG: HAD family hydrolase [Patescibacteria group bacterium]
MIRAVVFDLDGPIYDSFGRGLANLEKILSSNGVPFPDEKRTLLLRLWGKNGRQLLVDVFSFSESEADRMYEEWFALEKEPHPLVPGAREVLTSNVSKGIVNTILTSRRRRDLDHILSAHGIAEQFEFAQAFDDDAYAKPDPRAFSRTLHFLASCGGIDKHEIVFIGDTFSDARFGREAGIETLIVRTGPCRGVSGDQRPVGSGKMLTSIADFPDWIAFFHDQ